MDSKVTKVGSDVKDVKATLEDIELKLQTAETEVNDVKIRLGLGLEEMRTRIDMIVQALLPGITKGKFY